MKLYKFLPVMLAVLLLPAMAFAADGQSLAQSILDHVLELAVLVLTPAALLLVRKIMQLVEQKTGLHMSAQQEAMVEAWVQKGIHYAEEKGRAALKAGQPPLSGDEKKIMAVDFIESLIEAAGLDAMARDLLEKKVEAALHLKRTPA